jgi:hypothetical protein
MSDSSDFVAEGGCDCRSVRYRLASRPLIVHCCHCRWCQRESGSAFALNAMIESDRLASLGVAPEMVDTPSASGRGQRIARCESCKVAVWSHYAGAGPVLSFVRVGTLDDPDLLPPDVHIFTASKQPWVQLPAATPAFAEYYEREKVWAAASLARRKNLLPLIEAHQASLRSEA